MIKKTRQIIAAVSITAMTVLLLGMSPMLVKWLGWMPEIQLLPAVLAMNVVVVAALMVATLIFGRIYCSVVCPLGIMQDIIARLGHSGRRKPYAYAKAHTVLRLLFLAILVVTLLAGVGAVAALLAPYSTFARMVTHLLQPLWMWATTMFAGADDGSQGMPPEPWLRTWQALALSLVSMTVIAVMAWRWGRLWCNTVCPVGTVLGFLSRFSWLKARFNAESCRHCGKCTSHCKSGCINDKTLTIDHSRCVVCGNCLSQCEFGALRYAGGKLIHDERKAVTAASTRKDDAPDPSRRAFLIATGMLATAAVAEKAGAMDRGMGVLAGRKIPSRKTPVLPPGSLSAENMARRCTACQLCVSKCPHQVLRPSTRLLTFMQPEMSFERGWCSPRCTRCSRVCPTGAIQPITREEKATLKRGEAQWIERNCLPMTDGGFCGLCAMSCPTKAITMVERSNGRGIVQVPSVNASLCVGCGACENACPARPFPAIYVEGSATQKVLR